MRRLAVVVLVVVQAACAACRARSSPDAGPVASPDWLEGRPGLDAAAPVKGGTLVVRATAEPGGLNFLEDRFRDGWTVRMTRNLVFEALLEIDPADYSLKPQLAESWQDSGDHKTTTFVLRPNVTFHDGSTLSTKDVAAVLEAVKDPKRPTSSVRADLAELESWRVVDERTIELTWRRPSPFAVRQLAKLPIYPAARLAGDWVSLAERPVGTGPYAVASWERGAKLVLERRDGWWGGAPHVDRIVFRIVKDATVAAGLLERGEFDLFVNVQPALWRAMEAPDEKYAWARAGYRRVRFTDNSFSYIAWNEALPAFADVRVRRALAHLVPFEVIARTVDLGLELPTTCPHYPEGARCDPSVRPYAFSVDAARAELADAGFADLDGDGVLERDGVPLRFHFLVPATSVRLGKLVPLFQEQARQAGVEVLPEKVDVASMSARSTKRDFEAVSRVWTEFDADHDLTYIFHSSQADGGQNVIGYRSAEADRLLEAIRAEFDVDKRRELERALHRRLHEDQPYYFLSVRQSLDLAKTRVHGLRPSLVWYDLRRVWLTPQ